MNQYVEDYLNFIKEKLTEYNQAAMDLKEEDRDDEANLFKVRANICNIFTTMLQATDQKVKDKKLKDEQESNQLFCREYLKTFEQIPASWRSRLEQAKKNNDSITVLTEETKLDTANLLKSEFITLTGGTR